MIRAGEGWPPTREQWRRAVEMDRLLNGAPLIECGLCEREYHSYAVGGCPKHGGLAVCLYCCRRCKYHRETVGGQACGYASALTPLAGKGQKK